MDEAYLKIQAQINQNRPRLYALCYKTNNRFAYKQDLTGIPCEEELKLYNFTPTYDKWCLYCDNEACKLRCSSCKTVYYCDTNCQKLAWPIHKHHCKRDLFTLCILCGKNNPNIICDKCPVKYCSDECKQKIEVEHKEFDCDNYHKMFNT